MRRGVTLGLAVTAIALLFLSTADARTKKVQTLLDNSSITYEEGDNGDDVESISGTISASDPKCVSGRSIEVQKSPNQTLQSPFGTGTTDAQGHFTIPGDAPDGWYYAVYVEKVRIGSTVCKTTAAYGQFDLDAY
jgi:hypothetical protein